ncbi:hypothetical protein AAG906_008937 [Vitis piasezkii]
MTPVGKLHQSLLSFITNSLIIRKIVKNWLASRKKRLFKVISNFPIKEISIPNNISVLHNILGIPTMVLINAELSVYYVTKLATVPRYVIPDHHHASHLKPTTWPGIKLAMVTLG